MTDFGKKKATRRAIELFVPVPEYPRLLSVRAVARAALKRPVGESPKG
jgi:hypothetical protein